jgi:hypothetical protein
MSIEVFNRYEKKFIVDQATYEAILNLIEDNMELDPYNVKNGFYTISNLYCDTPNDDLIKKSLSKPIYKEKLRLRAYGVPELESKVFLEIKKKYKGLVNKRRTTLLLDEAYAFLASNEIPESKPYQNRQVLKEINFMLHQYDLKPIVYIAYDRQAFFTGDFRVTFDTNIRTRRYDLGLEYGDYGDQLIDDGKWLMEVKAGKTLPMWFVKLLSDHKLYATSFSKYGREYQLYIESLRPSKVLLLVKNEEKNKTSNSKITEMKGEPITCLNPYLPQQQAAR